MFKVATSHLSPDARDASVTFGRRDLGEFEADKLTVFLETFRELDPLKNDEAEPEVIISGGAGKFIVKTGQGKLFLYNASDLNIPYVELTASGIMASLGVTSAESTEEEAAIASTAEKPPRQVALTLLMVGLFLGLNGYTFYSLLKTDDVNELPAVAFLANEEEIVQTRRTVSGTFASGADEGDRGIVVGADGTLKFLEYGAHGEIRLENNDLYRVARRDGKTCLVSKESNLIDVTGADTIVYFHDIYRRRP